MNILFENIDFGSRTGPNGFGIKLRAAMIRDGHNVVTPGSVSSLGIIGKPDCQLTFIESDRQFAPTVQRLDGIYFNTAADWKLQNKKIEMTYRSSKSVVFQSNFNKVLTEKFFGKKDLYSVIPNGTDVEKISAIQPAVISEISSFDQVWSCAASWRPHKRLKDNIECFLERSGKNDCMLVMGSNPDYSIDHPRVFYVGDLDWQTMISVFKASDIFCSLSFLDHCPNVVVDARASGCKIICASSGGTKEIAGSDAVVIKDIEWDMSPIDLYSPPKLDFSEDIGGGIDSELDIMSVSKQYVKALNLAMIGE